VALDDDNFLGRWSRRKHAARRGEALPEPVAPPAETPAPVTAAAAPAAPAETAAPQELPPLESLRGLESEYKEFLRPGVDPATRGAALKKLFGDPHFNQMDGLDVYIDDYTKADPIPNAMLRVLNQARGLGLFDDEEHTERAPADVASAAAQPADAPSTAGALEAPAPPAESLETLPGAARADEARPNEALPTDIPAKTTGA
jgi:hypothetical protein